MPTSVGLSRAHPPRWAGLPSPQALSDCRVVPWGHGSPRVFVTGLQGSGQESQCGYPFWVGAEPPCSWPSFCPSV